MHGAHPACANDAGRSRGEAPFRTRRRAWQTRRSAQPARGGTGREDSRVPARPPTPTGDEFRDQPGLPHGAALLEFVRYDEIDFDAVASRERSLDLPPRYLAFIVAARAPDAVGVVNVGNAEEIDRLVAGFRTALTSPAKDPTGDECDSGAALRAALIDGLAPHLAGVERVIVAPDGELSKLPFEVLPLDDGRRLVEVYQICYVTAGRDVLRFGRTPGTDCSPPVVVADPAFNLAVSPAETRDPSPPEGPEFASQTRTAFRGLRFSRLPGTREEGESIAQMLGVRAWAGSDALESHLKHIQSPRVLHLATHGFFLEDVPVAPSSAVAGEIAHTRLTGPGMDNPLLRSGLALAGANVWLSGGAVPVEAEDGLLTAEDVSSLNLLDTDLVVLSACDTGLGEVRTGEGVYGLRRAFVLAGIAHWS